MNPFALIKGGYVDPEVLAHFSLAMKKDESTRCRALQKIVAEIERFPVESVGQCLYDMMPTLCRQTQESSAEHISEIFLHVLRKSESEVRIRSAGHWIGMFLSRPTKTGYKVVKALRKEGILKDLLAQYRETASTEMYIKSVLVEVSAEGSSEVSIERISKAETKEEVHLLNRLVGSLKEKGLLTAEIKETALKCAMSTKETQEKWSILCTVGAGYRIEDVVADSKKIDEKTFLQVVSSEYFREGVAEYGTELFITGCLRVPCEAFCALLEIAEKREVLLKKVLESNTAGFEHVRLEKDDFPYVNSLYCYNRVNEALLASSVRGTAIYSGLSVKEQIIRADLLGEKAEDVIPETIPQTSIDFIRREGIFEEGARTLPSSFFRATEDLSKEEHIYAVSQHPSLASKKTIDLVFRYKIFILSIISSLSDELMAYFMEKIENEPLDIVREVYDLTDGKIHPRYTFVLLGRLYTNPSYANKEFTSKLVLEGEIDKGYLMYLIERDGVEEESIYRRIVDEANTNSTGTQELTDQYIIMCEILESTRPAQADSKYLFRRTYSKWKNVLKCLKSETASLLTDILQVECELPLLGKRSIPSWLLGASAVGRIAHGMSFWQKIEQKKTPKVLAALLQDALSAKQERPEGLVIEAYIHMLNGTLSAAEIEQVQKIDISLVRNEKKPIILYFLLQIQIKLKSTQGPTITYTDAQAMHPRLVSLLAQTLPPTGIELANFTDLSREAIQSVQSYLEARPEQAAIAMRTDTLWEKTANPHRYEAYSPIITAVAKYYANSIINIYSMSKVEEDAVDSEVFFMLFDIPAIGNIKEMTRYGWRLFLAICSKVRSIEIRTLISAMVRAECKWLAFLISSEMSSLDLLGLFAKNFPVLARIFFKSSRNMKRVQSYFVSDVTPQLIREEASRPLQGVKINLKTIAGMHIISAAYKIEESELEVSISFPRDYPLNTPEVKVVRCVGVKKQRLQRLLLRVQMIMAEHCRISEALALWKIALDQAVNEIEECGICFFMVDEVTKHFPDTTCTKCSNQFHGSCLKKWLQRSNNLCPICREEIKSYA